VRVGGESRRLFLKQATGDPDVAAVSLRTATTRLRSALHDIVALAKKAERPTTVRRRALDAPSLPVWSLVLDEIQDRGVDLRPRLPFRGPRDFTGPARAGSGAARAAALLSTILKPIRLDPLTVADDADFLRAIEQQPNLPPPIKHGLRRLY
jgi:5-methylthioadenosine/S-adenosylhomocysteine deaminase